MPDTPPVVDKERMLRALEFLQADPRAKSFIEGLDELKPHLQFLEDTIKEFPPEQIMQKLQHPMAAIALNNLRFATGNTYQGDLDYLLKTTDVPELTREGLSQPFEEWRRQDLGVVGRAREDLMAKLSPAAAEEVVQPVAPTPEPALAPNPESAAREAAQHKWEAAYRDGGMVAVEAKTFIADEGKADALIQTLKDAKIPGENIVKTPIIDPDRQQFGFEISVTGSDNIVRLSQQIQTERQASTIVEPAAIAPEPETVAAAAKPAKGLVSDKNLADIVLSDGITSPRGHYNFAPDTAKTLANLQVFLGGSGASIFPEVTIGDDGKAHLTKLNAGPMDAELGGLSKLNDLLKTGAAELAKTEPGYEFSPEQTQAIGKLLPETNLSYTYPSRSRLSEIKVSEGVTLAGMGQFPLAPDTAEAVTKLKAYMGHADDSITPQFTVGEDGQAHLLELHTGGSISNVEGLNRLNALLRHAAPESAKDMPSHDFSPEQTTKIVELVNTLGPQLPPREAGAVVSRMQDTQIINYKTIDDYQEFVQKLQATPEISTGQSNAAAVIRNAATELAPVFEEIKTIRGNDSIPNPEKQSRIAALIEEKLLPKVDDISVGFIDLPLPAAGQLENESIMHGVALKSERGRWNAYSELEPEKAGQRLAAYERDDKNVIAETKDRVTKLLGENDPLAIKFRANPSIENYLEVQTAAVAVIESGKYQGIIEGVTAKGQSSVPLETADRRARSSAKDMLTTAEVLVAKNNFDQPFENAVFRENMRAEVGAALKNPAPVGAEIFVPDNLRVEEKAANNAWKMVDQATGKEYYLKLADEQEVAMTLKASQIDFGPDSLVSVPKSYALELNQVNPRVEMEISGFIQLDASGKKDFEGGRKHILVTEAIPGKTAVAQLMPRAADQEEHFASTLQGKPLTAAEWASFEDGVELMNKQGVFNHDLASNAFVSRGADGVARFQLIDFEPHTFNKIYPDSPHEDVEQVKIFAQDLVKSGTLEPAALERGRSAAMAQPAEEPARSTPMEPAPAPEAARKAGPGDTEILPKKPTPEFKMGAYEIGVAINNTIAKGVEQGSIAEAVAQHKKYTGVDLAAQYPKEFEQALNTAEQDYAKIGMAGAAPIIQKASAELKASGSLADSTTQPPAPARSEPAPAVHEFPEGHIESLLGAKEGTRFIVVANRELLDRALPVLQDSIAKAYKPTELNVYALKDGGFAIESADPKFYMGIGENSALYKQPVPIPNSVADITNGKLSSVGVSRFAVSEVGTERAPRVGLMDHVDDLLEHIEDSVVGAAKRTAAVTAGVVDRISGNFAAPGFEGASYASATEPQAPEPQAKSGGTKRSGGIANFTPDPKAGQRAFMLNPLALKKESFPSRDRGITFVPPNEAVNNPGDYEQVKIPAKALAEAAGLYENEQIPKPISRLKALFTSRNEFQQDHDDRYRGIAERINRGEPMESPSISINEEGDPSIFQGKHRILLMAERGEDIMVSVPKKDAPNVQTMLERVNGTSAAAAAAATEKPLTLVPESFGFTADGDRALNFAKGTTKEEIAEYLKENNLPKDMNVTTRVNSEGVEVVSVTGATKEAVAALSQHAVDHVPEAQWKNVREGVAASALAEHSWETTQFKDNGQLNKRTEVATEAEARNLETALRETGVAAENISIEKSDAGFKVRVTSDQGIANLDTALDVGHKINIFKPAEPEGMKSKLAGLAAKLKSGVASVIAEGNISGPPGYETGYVPETPTANGAVKEAPAAKINSSTPIEPEGIKSKLAGFSTKLKDSFLAVAAEGNISGPPGYETGYVPETPAAKEAPAAKHTMVIEAADEGQANHFKQELERLAVVEGVQVTQGEKGWRVEVPLQNAPSGKAQDAYLPARGENQAIELTGIFDQAGANGQGGLVQAANGEYQFKPQELGSGRINVASVEVPQVAAAAATKVAVEAPEKASGFKTVKAMVGNTVRAAGEKLETVATAVAERTPLPEPVRAKIADKVIDANAREGFTKVELPAAAVLGHGDTALQANENNHSTLRGKLDLVESKTGKLELPTLDFNAERGAFSASPEDAKLVAKVAAASGGKGTITAWVPDTQVEALKQYASVQNENVRLRAEAEAHAKANPTPAAVAPEAMGKSSALEVLGLPEGATPAQIKEAYQAKTDWHPGDPKMDKEQLAKLEAAHETLTRAEDWVPGKTTAAVASANVSATPAVNTATTPSTPANNTVTVIEGAPAVATTPATGTVTANGPTTTTAIAPEHGVTTATVIGGAAAAATMTTTSHTPGENGTTVTVNASGQAHENTTSTVTQHHSEEAGHGAIKAQGIASTFLQIKDMQEHGADKGQIAGAALNATSLLTSGELSAATGTLGQIAGVVNDTVRGYKEGGAKGAAVEGGKGTATAVVTTEVLAPGATVAGLKAIPAIAVRAKEILTSANEMKNVLVEAKEGLTVLKEGATLANLASQGKSLVSAGSLTALGTMGGKLGLVNSLVGVSSDFIAYKTGKKEENYDNVMGTATDAVTNLDPLGALTGGKVKIDKLMNVALGTVGLTDGKYEGISDIRGQINTLNEANAKAFTDGGLRHPEQQDPAKKPSMNDYKYLAAISGQVSKFVPGGKIDGHNVSTGKEFKQIDMSDPKNVKIYEKAINKAMIEQMDIMRENTSSAYTPSWLRSGEKAEKFDAAQMQLNMLTSAEKELQDFKKRNQEYAGTHSTEVAANPPEAAKDGKTTVATAEKKPEQMANGHDGAPKKDERLVAALPETDKKKLDEQLKGMKVTKYEVAAVGMESKAPLGPQVNNGGQSIA
jgi:hypothetical protein